VVEMPRLDKTESTVVVKSDINLLKELRDKGSAVERYCSFLYGYRQEI
jgi:hypothetical protein